MKAAQTWKIGFSHIKMLYLVNNSTSNLEYPDTNMQCSSKVDIIAYTLQFIGSSSCEYRKWHFLNVIKAWSV